uniref:Uncharacterized protein n=1 Tax=Trypanosoma vivax (strain Y486) TaxID=1055687 RepID=G0UCS8_TRYVY|nr:conserved hypothetical protein [Trypanosoma vivax Y486]
MRQKLLQRPAAIAELLAKGQQRDEETSKAGEVSGCPLETSMGAPLTDHVVDEIESWNRNLLSLETRQGFVLTDELVYKAISVNVRFGTLPHILNWLQKAAQEDRTPVPCSTLQELRLVLDFILSVIPTSTSSMTVATDALLGRVSTAIRRTKYPRRFFCMEEDSAAGDGDTEEGVTVKLVGTSPYVRHVFRELYIPLWRCLVQLGLLQPILCEGDVWREHMHKGKRRNVAEVVLSRMFCGASSLPGDCTKVKSGHHIASADSSVRNGNQPSILQAFTELFLLLAQCAAEAKEVNFLLQLQLIFCELFLEETESPSFIPDGAYFPRNWRLNRRAWCHSKEDEELLCRFANDVVATLCYGRYAHKSEKMLGEYIEGLLRGTVPTQEACGLRDVLGGEGGTEGAESKEEQPVEAHTDADGADVAQQSIGLQEVVDGLLECLFRCEAPVLPDASVYASMLRLRIARAEGDSFEVNHGTASRFSVAELEWMQRHCLFVHRWRTCNSEGSQVMLKEFMEFFQPGGAVARGLEMSRGSLEDTQCFLALVMETIAAVAAGSSVPQTWRCELVMKVISDLMVRMGEVAPPGHKLYLPLYSAGCGMLLLAPMLGSVHNPGPEAGSGPLANAPLVLSYAAEMAAPAGEERLILPPAEAIVSLLRAILVSVLEQPVCFGNVYGAVLMTLSLADMWDEVLAVLRLLDSCDESVARPPEKQGQTVDEDKEAGGLSSVLVDQRVWAWLFVRARDMGHVKVCLFLREKREKLFF